LGHVEVSGSPGGDIAGQPGHALGRFLGVNGGLYRYFAFQSSGYGDSLSRFEISSGILPLYIG
jgi:hypothetical protein